MKKPKLIFFSSGVQRKIFSHYLFDKSQIETFPIHYVLRKEDVKPGRTIAILWLSNNERSWLKKIEDLSQHFPKLPIFLIADDPRPEDLLAIIPFRIRRVFTLPLEESLLSNAIKEEVCHRSYIDIWSRGMKLFRTAQKFIGSIAFPTWHKPSQQSLAIVPQTLSNLTDKRFEEEKEIDLKVQFFGKFEITDKDGSTKAFGNTKNASLLAFLFYHHQKPVHREKLMERFWGEVAPSSARNSLNVAIHAIRRIMSKAFPGQEIIVFENDCYSIGSDLEIVTDVERFNYFWQKGKAIEHNQGLENSLGPYNKALSIYKRDFLYEMPYEEWCESVRDNLKETYLFILNRLSNYHFQMGGYDACINICKQMLEKDPCLEEVHQKLMQCYCKLGLSGLAKKQYQKCCTILEEELETRPSEPTHVLYEKIMSGQC